MSRLTEPIKIILAEDDSAIAMAYKQGLSYHGFDIVVAVDGREAVAAIQKSPPDILLLDIIMPNMDGFEVLETLRAQPEHVKLPVIVLTNLGQPSDAERVYKLGAKAYLIKANLSLKELVGHIHNAIGSTAEG